MTAEDAPPGAMATFKVLSRTDLKIAAGGFKDACKLGRGPRYVAPTAPTPSVNLSLARRGSGPRASASRPRTRT
jgi:hypothetical protein